MRKRLLLILALIVLLPLGLLGWLGARLASNEQQMLSHQLRIFGDGQLRAVDTVLQGVFGSLANELLQIAAFAPADLESLRRLPHEHPRIRQVFLMSPRGERLHPPRDAQLTAAEQEFLARTEPLWRNRGILYEQLPSDAVAAAPPTRGLAAPSASAEQAKPGGPPPHGWYLWHAGDETNHLFWALRPNGDLIGFELHPARLLADLIAALPTTAAGAAAAGSRYRLINAGGDLVYAWGGLEPAADAPPVSVLPLSHPLSSWRLTFHARALGGAGGGGLVWGAALLAAAAALLGLGYTLYREHSREMRLAAQRVSFVNQVSHELKTPLTNIRLYAELLEDELPEEEPGARRYLDVIQAECQRLGRLINNVLSFARAEKRRLTLNLRPARLDACIDNTLRAFRPALEAKDVALNVRLGAPAPALLDADAVEQILTNLLSNVEKYAAGGKRVDVDSRQAGERLEIDVRDYGPGIPKTERGRIFQPFYRISDRLTDGVAGTGIGLSIARELARLHGGDLELLESERGALFRVSLKAAPAGGEA